MCQRGGRSSPATSVPILCVNVDNYFWNVVFPSQRRAPAEDGTEETFCNSHSSAPLVWSAWQPSTPSGRQSALNPPALPLWVRPTGRCCLVPSTCCGCSSRQPGRSGWHSLPGWGQWLGWCLLQKVLTALGGVWCIRPHRVTPQNVAARGAGTARLTALLFAAILNSLTLTCSSLSSTFSTPRVEWGSPVASSVCQGFFLETYLSFSLDG